MYDVPVKGTDKEWQEGSEEVYNYLLCAVGPLEGEYEPGLPEAGFLYPAFRQRSTACNYIICMKQLLIRTCGICYGNRNYIRKHF